MFLTYLLATVCKSLFEQIKYPYVNVNQIHYVKEWRNLKIKFIAKLFDEMNEFDKQVYELANFESKK